MNKDKRTILLIGMTGHGISSLGNFIFQKKDAFEIYPPDFPRTKGIKIKEYGNLSIIDYPGLSDPHYSDECKEMVEYIKKSYNLNGIIIVYNFHECRFSSTFQNMIQMICNQFPFEIFQNICFVFTHYYGHRDKLEKEKKYKTTQIIRILKDIYKKKIEEQLEYFFVDSDLDEPDVNSKKEYIKIMKWIKDLTFINNKEIKSKNILYKREYYKYPKNVSVTYNNEYKIKRVIKKEVHCVINQDNKEIELDSKIIDDTTDKIPL